MQDFASQFNQLLTPESRVLITSHIRPDADAICAVLGMRKLVISSGAAQVDCIFTGNDAGNWDWLPDYEWIKFVDDVLQITEGYDIVIFLDGGEFMRFGNSADNITNALSVKPKLVCIDHHPGEIQGFDLVYQDVSATSTCQLVYELFKMTKQDDLDLAKNIDKNTAFTLLVGILGDTGGLKFINAQKAHVFDVVKQLVQIADVDIQNITAKFDEISQEQFKLIQILVANTKFVNSGKVPPFCYSYLDTQDVVDAQTGDVKAAVSQFLFMYVRNVGDYKWGFVLKPNDLSGKLRYDISLRSAPGVMNVRELAIKHFNGGGHVLASGGEFIPTTTDPITEIEGIITNYGSD